MVEGVVARADGVLGARHLGEQARRAVHAQLADVHVRLRRAHRPPLTPTQPFSFTDITKSLHIYSYIASADASS